MSATNWIRFIQRQPEDGQVVYVRMALTGYPVKCTWDLDSGLFTVYDTTLTFAWPFALTWRPL